ncbi:MAG: orotidine 5'-phosphate decarboxylase / HUMPS family protein [Candidatus Micrarchaeota archaeon]
MYNPAFFKAAQSGLGLSPIEIPELDSGERYLQIAFNHDLHQAFRILPRIPRSSRILIEAGTPFIKREGARGIAGIRSLWRGMVVADLKVADGAVGEVQLAAGAGANAATVLGNASIETIDLFIESCANLGVVSMVDTLGVDDPLQVLRQLKKPPEVVVLHKGRDEESTRGKVIPYKQVNRIRSKFDCVISAAGGVDLREARSAIFNGANIVVANIVSSSDPWAGICETDNVAELAKQFLETIS